MYSLGQVSLATLIVAEIFYSMNQNFSQEATGVAVRFAGDREKVRLGIPGREGLGGSARGC